MLLECCAIGAPTFLLNEDKGCSLSVGVIEVGYIARVKCERSSSDSVYASLIVFRLNKHTIGLLVPLNKFCITQCI